MLLIIKYELVRLIDILVLLKKNLEWLMDDLLLEELFDVENLLMDIWN